MGTADEWARALGEKLKAEKAESDRTADETAMNRQIVAEQMPLIWEELCREFQKHCEAFNEQAQPQRKLVFHRLGSHDFRVRPDALDEIIAGHYEYATYRISLKTQTADIEWFAASVLHIDTGRVRLVSNKTQRETSTESIARDAIADGVSSA